MTAESNKPQAPPANVSKGTLGVVLLAAILAVVGVAGLAVTQLTGSSSGDSDCSDGACTIQTHGGHMTDHGWVDDPAPAPTIETAVDAFTTPQMLQRMCDEAGQIGMDQEHASFIWGYNQTATGGFAAEDVWNEVRSRMPC